LPEPKIYGATTIAAKEHQAKPLDGTQEAAQAYVDGITQSHWWKRHCTPSWMGDRQGNAVPTRVWVVDSSDPTKGADTMIDRLYWFEGKRCPKIVVGNDNLYGNLRAIEDPWVILHELAHVWTVDEKGWHGQKFCYAFHKLVGKHLGEESAAALKEAMWATKIRLDYRLI
jgi:hypothetical protein